MKRQNQESRRRKTDDHQKATAARKAKGLDWSARSTRKTRKNRSNWSNWTIRADRKGGRYACHGCPATRPRSHACRCTNPISAYRTASSATRRGAQGNGSTDETQVAHRLKSVIPPTRPQNLPAPLDLPGVIAANYCIPPWPKDLIAIKRCGPSIGSHAFSVIRESPRSYFVRVLRDNQFVLRANRCVQEVTAARSPSLAGGRVTNRLMLRVEA